MKIYLKKEDDGNFRLKFLIPIAVSMMAQTAAQNSEAAGWSDARQDVWNRKSIMDFGLYFFVVNSVLTRIDIK